MLPDLDVILAQDAGATFFTADLHVHSYGFSHDVNDKTMSISALIDAALARGIGVLAITDHNNDGQVMPSLEYGSKFSDRLLVIPGVEISTANGHLLVYCDPRTPELIGTLLAKIDLKGPKGARDSHTAWSMATVIDTAAQLGAIAIAAHVDRDKTGFEKLADGYPNWKKDIILAQSLYGLEFDDPTNLGWYSPEDGGTDAAGQRRAIFGDRAARSELGIARLAAVQNSDAHTLAEFSADRPLTRYKMAELSFSSFRTALVDSEARVRAVATVPPSIPRIIGMKMIGGFVDGEIYRLSPNLNCFIGGRGTGKSTAVQALAYAVGANHQFDRYDNCAQTTIVVCEDANGILYRYERQRGGTWKVLAQDKNGNGIEAPAGVFKVEFYKQGHLAEVAKDPLRNTQLLQDFLDQHLALGDALADESALIQELEHNSAELKPLEAGALQLGAKREQLKDVETKLKIAEQGKLKEVAAAQSQVGAEKAFLGTLQTVAKSYEAGISLSVVKKDYNTLRQTAGEFTTDTTTAAAFQVCESIIDKTNAWLKSEEERITNTLKAAAAELREAVKPVPGRHAKWEERIAIKIDELRKQGLSGNLAQLSQLIAQRGQLTADITKLAAQQERLAETRQRRSELLTKLATVRAVLSSRRRAQVTAINETFKRTIRDYSVYLRYVPGGINTDFVKERRQVIIVTHNANIAVLGDSELLFPMMRSGNAGKAFERGAIDRQKTKVAAQDVLEGGATAFLRRKAIYGVG